jgi:hypothetical protein
MDNDQIDKYSSKTYYYSKKQQKWITSKTLKTYKKREGRFGYYDCNCIVKGCHLCIPNFNKKLIRNIIQNDIKEQVNAFSCL